MLLQKVHKPTLTIAFPNLRDAQLQMPITLHIYAQLIFSIILISHFSTKIRECKKKKRVKPNITKSALTYFLP